MVIDHRLIDFFKKHKLYNKEMFKYFEEHSTMIDPNYEDERMLTGCAYSIDRYTGILKDIHITLPYIIDESTLLDSVHELTHAIFSYYKIGKRFEKDITIETLPLLYERLYIMDNPSQKLEAYGKHLDSLIDETDPEYYFAINARETLLKSYNYNPTQMIKIVSQMGKKYYFNEWKNKHKRR